MKLTESDTHAIQGLKQSAIRWIAGHGFGLPESEDIFHQAIARVLQTESNPENPEKMSSWFYQILKNTMIDEFRKTKRENQKAIELKLDLERTLDEPTEKKLCDCVDLMIEELPESEKRLLEGHFFEGKSYKTLALESGLGESAIRVKAMRAREKLKTSLKRECGINEFGEATDCEC